MAFFGEQLCTQSGQEMFKTAQCLYLAVIKEVYKKKRGGGGQKERDVEKEAEAEEGGEGEINVPTVA